MTAPKKRKAGRPSLGAAAKSRTITIKLSDVEYTALAAAIARANAALAPDQPRVTTSSWMRLRGLAPLVGDD